MVSWMLNADGEREYLQETTIGNMTYVGEYGQERISIQGDDSRIGLNAQTTSWTIVPGWKDTSLFIDGDFAQWNGNTFIESTYIDDDMDSREDWRCPYCGALNPGESRQCGTQFIGCGAPRRE